MQIVRAREEWLLDNLSLVKEVLPQLAYLEPEDIMFRLSAPHGILLARNGGLAGFAVWHETLPGVAYIWMIGVLEKYRRRGIGRRLLAETIREIKRKGYALVWVKVGRDKPWWIKTHISMGFRIWERVEEGKTSVYKLVKLLKPFPPYFFCDEGGFV